MVEFDYAHEIKVSGFSTENRVTSKKASSRTVVYALKGYFKMLDEEDIAKFLKGDGTITISAKATWEKI